jgi:hypothetical protein
MSDDDAEIGVLFNKIIEFYNKTIYDYNVSLNKSIITQTTINNVLGTDYSDYTTDIDDKGNIVQVDKGEIQKVKEDVKKDKKRLKNKLIHIQMILNILKHYEMV